VAPDGSDVRVLLGLAGGGMAEFELGAGKVSAAVTHRTIDEIWYVLEGRGGYSASRCPLARRRRSHRRSRALDADL